MLIPILLFVVGLVMLIFGGDWFVDGATGIAHRFHIPEIIIGATIVSIGTTLPEVMVSATSAVSGHPEIAYGNAIGSIICNTSLIAAITIAVRPQKVKKSTLKKPVLFFFAAEVFYAFNAYVFGGFSRVAGIILLCGFVAYMLMLIFKGEKEADVQEEEENGNNSSAVKEWILLIAGAALIAIGADLLVDNGTLIAQALGVPESVIALTFVALGTSLPELITAVTSLIKGRSSLSLGNIIGANLFNLVLVSGAACTLNPFSIPASRTVAGINSSLLIDVPLSFAVMLILCIPAITKEKLSRWQGILLLAIYAAFCVFQFAV